ncbi:MAG: DNA translocase FtsK 4TM domain-containing protein [Deltaproteobacteria bacterium]|nr:DNA translocase FtsK 4TM domain-containing protein [Deltaproteobacteria bacterium]
MAGKAARVAKGGVREKVEQATGTLRREVEALFAIAGACYLGLSFLSYTPGRAAGNVGGPVGHLLSDLFVQAFGLAAFLIPASIVIVAIVVLRGGSLALSVVRGAVLTAELLLAATTLALVRGPGREAAAGGWVGGFLASVLAGLFNSLGAFLIVATGLVLTTMVVTGGSLVGGMTAVARRATATRGAIAGAFARWRERHRPDDDEDDVVALPPPRERRERESRPERGKRSALPPPEPAPPIVVNEPEPRPAKAGKGRASKALKQEEFHFSSGTAQYELPPLGFLDAPVDAGVQIDEDSLIASSRILQSKLADFGVDGKVVAVRPGPVITTFEFEPAAGVKVNRVVNLADDLSMALRAHSVRILAPIPGKPVVGIEVSNPRREKVWLRDIIASDQFQRSESKLTLALGKDTTGNTYVSDLGRMPHLLMAGATGTGKSVSLNAMIMSILYEASPHDVRFIMIDPKMLELSVYDNIPHLLVPVVTDPKKSAYALANVMQEMDRRYRLLKEKGVRNIDSYNKAIAGEQAEKQAGVIELTEPEDPEEAAAPFVPGQPLGNQPLVHEHLPRIVIIVDELADLMMTVGREVEESITRLAQKARAAGIHLILATQRPSVDVITGLIKANFPARISFQVTSRIDSRTILDAQGSERLLGAGDCLFLPPGTARLTRVHGAFVSDEEVQKVVEFWRKQGAPSYRMELLEGGEDEEGGDDEDDDLHDEMYDMAVRVVTESRQASISWLQRKLRVGYNRAARMIERMEREGVVSRAEGARPREVLARGVDAED